MSSDPTGDALAAILADPSGLLVALDFDGTLAPLVADPALARPAAGVVEVLTALGSAVGTLAVITGRPAAVAVELGGLADVPGLVVLGHYGLQRWEAGEITSPDPVAGIAGAREVLADLLGKFPTGVHLEDKEHSLVVHTRRAKDPERAFEYLRGPLEALAQQQGLTLEPGRLALELRPPGVDKGAALRELVAERSPTVLLLAGDDLGDLSAVAVLHELRAGGLPGLVVCSDADDSTPAQLRDAADLVVAGPDGVVRFLQGILATLP